MVGEAERLGEVGGQVGLGGGLRTSRTTRRPAGAGSSSASRPGRRPAKSRRSCSASRGYCARPCLTRVCQPEHQRWTGRVTVRSSVTSSTPSTSSGCPARTGAPDRSSLDIRSVSTPRSRRPDDVVERLPRSPPIDLAAPAATGSRSRRSVNAVSSGRTRPWWPGGRAPGAREPDGGPPAGVGGPPRALDRGGARLVEPGMGGRSAPQNLSVLSATHGGRRLRAPGGRRSRSGSSRA